MQIKVKEYYNKKIKVATEPSKYDIELNFFTQRQEVELQKPYTFPRGARFDISLECLSCKDKISILSEQFRKNKGLPYVYNLGLLSTANKNRTFIDSIHTVFPYIEMNYLNDYWILISPPENRSSIFDLLYFKCPHCGEKHLSIYLHIPPDISETSNGNVTVLSPNQLCLYDIARVDFDEPEFFKESGLLDA
ncbi:hypothetical protein ETU09_09930 [Apibacter muscae]|uniref:Uncharacterized protein n=1 Tax=Apibacter muscae TaxID=2509004 RepID=A0A563DA86_9FLAO|nr:hypothetical protein [Apibacter muscae]TWP26863.1 hypothetical protein ETU09_09930 [Apibacter muscae]